MITFGLEEEVFITEPFKPSLQSLYYLGRLFWKDPKYYYFGSSSNFARGRDIIYGLMGGVEITTFYYSEIDDLIDDFKRRRRELSEVCEGLIVPMGHLITHKTPTNVCALQIHIGGVTNKKTYYNIAYFLPLLFLLTASSPLVKGRYFGPSYRLAFGYAIGPPEKNPWYRFQDIIFSKRLGTIEVKIFDPWWDLERIRILLEALKVIVSIKEEMPFNIDNYKYLRQKAAKEGYSPDFEELYQKLNKYYPISKEYFLKTPADEIVSFYKKYGLLKTYSALDSAYRWGKFYPQREIQKINKNPFKITAGLMGYFLPRIPYRLWKFWKDWM